MGNKFSHRRGYPKKPSICISKPPAKPYQYPPYPSPEYSPDDQAMAAWVESATLPPVPSTPFEPITVRNLIYHCYPNKENSAWLNNLANLKPFFPLFNGKRTLCVTEGPGLMPVHTVVDTLDEDVAVLSLVNDPRLRETASFLDLLRAVRSTRSNEATFYAHSKGASSSHTANGDKRLAIRFWRNRMYRELLDRWPDINAALRTAAAAGCFKIDYSCFPDHVMHSPTGLEWGSWHYAGNFFWFRHDCIFRNPRWSAIADDPYASEMWLGNLIDTQLAASVYQPWNPMGHPVPNLYDPNSHVNPIF